MQRKFIPDGSALSAVFQIVLGATFRAVRYDPWKDGKPTTSYLHIVDEQGEIIGDADDYLYPNHGWTVRLFDGSYSGFVDRDQIQILEAQSVL